MRKLIFLSGFLLSALLFRSYKPDEGMYPLSEISKLDLQKAGLKIGAKELFNPGGTSLVDAIVRVGGCTGSFISSEGLMITNHHCAFSFVQAISSTKNNYIREGYYAQSREVEAPAKGLVCKITASYADVSEQVLQGTQNMSDPSQRMTLIASNLKAITNEENRRNPGMQCEMAFR